MTLQQLQQENAELKQDMRIIKNTVTTVTDGLKVSENGVFPEKVNVTMLVKGAIKELTNHITPNIFGLKKESLIDKIELKPLVDLMNKYKNL